MLYIILALFAVVVMLIVKAFRKCFDTPSYMPELSHPAIRHAQEVANLTRKVQLIVPNIFGGYDIIPAERVTLESSDRFAGVVRPQAFTGALKCLN